MADVKMSKHIHLNSTEITPRNSTSDNAVHVVSVESDSPTEATEPWLILDWLILYTPSGYKRPNAPYLNATHVIVFALTLVASLGDDVLLLSNAWKQTNRLTIDFVLLVIRFVMWYAVGITRFIWMWTQFSFFWNYTSSGIYQFHSETTDEHPEIRGVYGRVMGILHAFIFVTIFLIIGRTVFDAILSPPWRLPLLILFLYVINLGNLVAVLAAVLFILESMIHIRRIAWEVADAKPRDLSVATIRTWNDAFVNKIRVLIDGTFNICAFQAFLIAAVVSLSLYFWFFVKSLVNDIRAKQPSTHLWLSSISVFLTFVSVLFVVMVGSRVSQSYHWLVQNLTNKLALVYTEREKLVEDDSVNKSSHVELIASELTIFRWSVVNFVATFQFFDTTVSYGSLIKFTFLFTAARLATVTWDSFV